MLYDVGLSFARHPTVLGNGLCPAGATPVGARMGSMVGGGCAGRILTNQYGFSNFNNFDDKGKKIRNWTGMSLTTTGGLSSKQWTMTNHYEKSHRLLSTRL